MKNRAIRFSLIFITLALIFTIMYFFIVYFVFNNNKTIAYFPGEIWGELVYNDEIYYPVTDYNARFYYYYETGKHFGYIETTTHPADRASVYEIKDDDERNYLYITQFRDIGYIYSKNKKDINKSGKITSIDLLFYNDSRITDEEDIEFLLSLENLSGPLYSYDITNRPNPYVSNPVIYYENCPIASGKLGSIIYIKSKIWAYIPQNNHDTTDNVRHGFYITDEEVISELERIMEPFLKK